MLWENTAEKCAMGTGAAVNGMGCIMKAVTAELPRDLDSVELHVFADEHMGDKYCDMRDIMDRIEHIRNTDNAYCVLNGDLMNNATKTSVSDSYSEVLTPMQQVNRAVELFTPIKHKILAITTGNHEWRSYKKEGIDLSYLVAREMGLQDVFDPAGVFLVIRFGRLNRRKGEGRRVTYTMYMTHGTGGGRKEGGKANRLADMASIVDADVYLHAHTHLPMIMRQSFYRASQSNGTVAPVDKLFVNTSAALDYGGYGQTFEYKPSSKKRPVIHLDGHRREMSAVL